MRVGGALPFSKNFWVRTSPTLTARQIQAMSLAFISCAQRTLRWLQQRGEGQHPRFYGHFASRLWTVGLDQRVLERGIQQFMAFLSQKYKELAIPPMTHLLSNWSTF
jgi:hypothetical protein